MKNATKSKIIIEMEHLDHAHRFTEALKVFQRKSAGGGDAELAYIGSYGEMRSCGVIGHDVLILDVKHEIDK